MFRSLLFLFICTNLCAQTIPDYRKVNWSLANTPDININGFNIVNLGEEDLNITGKEANDIQFKIILDELNGQPSIINFPEGEFLFNSTIQLPSNIVIRGQGSDKTKIVFDLGGSGDGFSIKGQISNNIKSSVKESFVLSQNFIIVDSPEFWKIGKWLKLTMDDADLVTSDWAKNSVGQIIKIESISNDTLFLSSPLRFSANTFRNPVITSIEPVENVGIECLSILRKDDTAPQQTSTIFFENAVDCWVKGVESANCTFAHVTIASSSNIKVKQSYFHDGFDYGGGGRAYGVVLQFSSGECLIENNIFQHLRHSVLLQAGANGNAITYNYSREPFWTSFPSDAAGDMVLHGNYVFANLFEQNICQNIVIDDSHGPNGPLNTFFRNRAEKYGIFFSANNSPSQNIVGNEITNLGFPYSLLNYTINGTDHLIYSNNNKGVIVPENITDLPEESLIYYERPEFLSESQFGGIGSPNIISLNTIPALERWNSLNPMLGGCTDSLILQKNIIDDEIKFSLFPNPFNDQLTIQSENIIDNLTIINQLGRILIYKNIAEKSLQFNTSEWSPGFYFVIINSGNKKINTFKTIKI